MERVGTKAIVDETKEILYKGGIYQKRKDYNGALNLFAHGGGMIRDYYDNTKDSWKDEDDDDARELTKLFRAFVDRLRDVKALLKPQAIVRARRELPPAVSSMKEPSDSDFVDLQRAVNAERPNVRWNDVIGLETAKSLLNEAVLAPTLFKRFFTGGRKPWRGILLYGPPGTGKSYLAKALATESGTDTTFFAVSPSMLQSKYVAQGMKLVDKLFNDAAHMQPSVIFIDEIDSIAPIRGDGHETSTQVVGQLLTAIDGVTATGSVVVVGATNRPWALDPAMLRRFQKRIYVPLPENAVVRMQMFQLGMKNVDAKHHTLDEKDYWRLGTLTEGYSPSDIANVVNDALAQPMRTARWFVLEDGVYKQADEHAPKARLMNLAELVQQNAEAELRPVEFGDFVESLKTIQPTVVKDRDLQRLEEWTREFGSQGD